MIVAKGKGIFSPGNDFLGTTDNRHDGEDCYALDTTKMQLQAPLGPLYTYAPSTTHVQQGEWYFVAVTYNGQQISLYTIPMDPAKQLTQISPFYTSALTGSMGSNIDPLTIGSYNMQQYPYWINGAMDELAIFNRGLSNSEVYSIYDYLWNATLSVGNNEAAGDVRLYPNPATSQLNISGHLGSNTATVEVYNIPGQLVLAEQVSTTGGQLQHSVNTSKLPTGTYTLKLTADGAVKNIRFTVQQ